MKKTLKRIAAALTAAAICACSLMISAFAETDPFIHVKTAKQLMNMKPGGEYILDNDIDLRGVKWKPVMKFSGMLDGDGHSIIGLTSTTYGLFGELDGADICNLKLVDADIRSKFSTVGGIAAVIKNDKKALTKQTTIQSCFVSGVVASCRTKYGNSAKSSTAGAIVGKNYAAYGKIRGCYSTAIVGSERVFGGLCGVNYGDMEQSVFDGELVSAYNNFDLGCTLDGSKDDDFKLEYCSGGICGINYGNIKSCLSNCKRYELTKYCGGIVGANQKQAKVMLCSVMSDVPDNDADLDTRIGLIAGVSTKNTYASGFVSNTLRKKTGRKYIGSGKPSGKIETLSDKEFVSDNMWYVVVDSYSDCEMAMGILDYWRITGNNYAIKGERIVYLNDTDEDDGDTEPIDLPG